MAALAYLLIGILVLWHIYGAAVASWHISASEFFEPWQKTAQHLIAWCLPILGVALILRVLGPEVRKRRPGWIPLLEPIILASFGMSVSEAIDSASADYNSSTEGSHHDLDIPSDD